MAQEQMVSWCTLFLTIIGKEAPLHAMDEDLDFRERNHFWKAKKWAYANLNRLFIRYWQTIPAKKGEKGEESQRRPY